MFESHSFEIRLGCHYLLQTPATPPDVAVIALHGYGMSAETMLRLVAPTLDGTQAVVSLQAPFQHYQGEGPGSGIAAYNWGIRQHHPESVRLHHEMVLRVIDDIGKRFGIGPKGCVLLGFSQPVGLNYRFVGTYPDAVGGVIGICGGVPKDWEEDKYRDFVTPLLHIAREQDEFFPVATVAGFRDRLLRHAANVEFHLLPGAHRYPRAAKEIVRDWLRRRVSQKPEPAAGFPSTL
jgi:phospholipase/carboxylesterase